MGGWMPSRQNALIILGLLGLLGGLLLWQRERLA